jgi:DNA mismatch repair protein MutS
MSKMPHAQRDRQPPTHTPKPPPKHPRAENIVDQYLRCDAKYRAIYGEKTFVFLESGHFYEIYDVVPPPESPHLTCCRDILGILITRRDKTKPDSPYMAGIPTHSIRRHVKLLVEQHRYTLVFLTQTCMEPTVVREVTKILSPGCNFSEDVHDSTDLGQSVLLSLFVEVDRDGECYLHLVQFDANLGALHMKGIQADTEDELGVGDFTQARFDRLRAYLETVLFHEMIIHIHLHPGLNTDAVQPPVQELADAMRQEGKAIHITTLTDPYMLSRTFQQQYLERKFNTHGSSFCSILETLELEKEDPHAIGNLILLLEFVSKHNSDMVKMLRKPTTASTSPATAMAATTIACYNNVYSKLNIFQAPHKAAQSLFQHLNCTNTKMGERLLHQRLTNVACDIDVIQHRYALAHCILTTPNAQAQMDDHVRSVDLDRLLRRFATGTLQPNDIPKVAVAHSNMLAAFDFVNRMEGEGEAKKEDGETDMQQLLRTHLHDGWWVDARELKAHLERTFDLDACNGARIGQYTECIFKEGVSEDVDAAREAYETRFATMECVRQTLHECIQETIPLTKKGGRKKESTTVSVQLKFSEKDGYCLETSTVRGARLQTELQNQNKAVRERLLQAGIEMADLTVTKGTKTTSKLQSQQIRTGFQHLIDTKDTYDTCITERYVQTLHDLYSRYFESCLSPAIQLFAELDVALCTAKLADKYRYVQPVLVANGTSSLAATELRHPLIERLVMGQGKAFVPSDISVSAEQSYLLYGVNSVGKSSLLKSVAVAVLMAQAGLYVAASTFRLCPFRKLFARTGNDDNMFVHHSSFVKEMTETKEIVKHCDAHSLVIADELCASTEIESATRIVGGLLHLLATKKTAFMFATHLFALQDNFYVRHLIHERKVLHNIHLRVRFERDMLVFERQISEGLPENRLYGALVAEKVIDSPAFSQLLRATDAILANNDNDDADEDDKMETARPTVAPTPSRYNSAVWVQKCAICSYQPQTATDMPLDTHHIHAQCTADARGYIGHTHKNEAHNLVVLCKECHRKTHAGQIMIHGYTDTMSGRKLRYDDIYK